MPSFTEMRRPALWADYRAAARARRAGDDRRATEPRTVVLGYDGSEAARRALVRAAEAAGGGGRVVVVTAVPAVDPFEHGRALDSLIEDPRRLVEEASALLRSHDLEISTRVERDDPAEALVAIADELDAELIVVGARGASYPARALRGSVGERLVARSPCDLLVAR